VVQEQAKSKGPNKGCEPRAVRELKKSKIKVSIDKIVAKT
jgi:hypothetical protein